MPVQAYEDLRQINQGFQRVLNSLHRLRQRPGFKRAQVAEFREWVREARAATNSYVTGVLETEETEAAGRLYRRRRALQQERENGEAT